MHDRVTRWRTLVVDRLGLIIVLLTIGLAGVVDWWGAPTWIIWPAAVAIGLMSSRIQSAIWKRQWRQVYATIFAGPVPADLPPCSAVTTQRSGCLLIHTHPEYGASVVLRGFRSHQEGQHAAQHWWRTMLRELGQPGEIVITDARTGRELSRVPLWTLGEAQARSRANEINRREIEGKSSGQQQGPPPG